MDGRIARDVGDPRDRRRGIVEVRARLVELDYDALCKRQGESQLNDPDSKGPRGATCIDGLVPLVAERRQSLPTGNRAGQLFSLRRGQTQRQDNSRKSPSGSICAPYSLYSRVQGRLGRVGESRHHPFDRDVPWRLLSRVRRAGRARARCKCCRYGRGADRTCRRSCADGGR